MIKGSSRFESDSRYFNEISKLKIKCKCGHSQTIYTDKKICGWCGNWIYKNPKQEFKERVLEKIREFKNEKSSYKKNS